MQHKRPYYSRAGILSMALVGVIIAILAFLMIKEIPAPSVAIEKPLDAKAFLKP
jgi:hypothetical protein